MKYKIRDDQDLIKRIIDADGVQDAINEARKFMGEPSLLRNGCSFKLEVWSVKDDEQTHDSRLATFTVRNNNPEGSHSMKDIDLMVVEDVKFVR